MVLLYFCNQWATDIVRHLSKSNGTWKPMWKSSPINMQCSLLLWFCFHCSEISPLCSAHRAGLTRTAEKRTTASSVWWSAAFTYLTVNWVIWLNNTSIVMLSLQAQGNCEEHFSLFQLLLAKNKFTDTRNYHKIIKNLIYHYSFSWK